MINKLLLAVDGSGRSREMANMLLPFPSLQRAEVTVLHVIPVSASAEGLTEYRLAGERILDREANSLKLSPENRTTYRLEEGDPKSVVTKLAEELQPDLLVMGSRGMGRIQAILANSVSQYVFQLSAVPMLLVKDDVYIKTIRSVMVSLDSSEASLKGLDYALDLIRGAGDIEVLLLRVVKKEGVAADDPVLKEAESKVKRQGMPFRTVVRVGDPGKEICAAADELNASLLVIGSPDRRPSIARSLPDLDRLLGASVSDYVRVHAGCPVLLFRMPSES